MGSAYAMEFFYYLLSFLFIFLANAVWLVLTFSINLREDPIRNIAALTAISAALMVVMCFVNAKWICAGIFAATLVGAILTFVISRPKKN